MSFDALPAEVLQRVFQFLDTRSIYRAQQVCSTWAAAVRSSARHLLLTRLAEDYCPPEILACFNINMTNAEAASLMKATRVFDFLQYDHEPITVRMAWPPTSGNYWTERAHPSSMRGSALKLAYVHYFGFSMFPPANFERGIAPWQNDMIVAIRMALTEATRLAEELHLEAKGDIVKARLDPMGLRRLRNKGFVYMVYRGPWVFGSDGVHLRQDGQMSQLYMDGAVIAPAEYIAGAFTKDNAVFFAHDADGGASRVEETRASDDEDTMHVEGDDMHFERDDLIHFGEGEDDNDGGHVERRNSWLSGEGSAANSDVEESTE